MPRMIFWNVQHFSYDKFFARKRKRSADDEESYGVNLAQRYRKVLQKTITAHDPDFIVIVEARPGGRTGGGTLLRDRGAMEMLEELRTKDDHQWALVPPVISGMGNAGEGVVVYFRRTKDLYFTGPWRWPGSQGPAVRGGNTGPYPEDYGEAFTYKENDNRVVPGRALHNPGQAEAELAGQCRFTAGGGQGVPPAPVMFGALNARSPFRTTFYDKAADRNYTIMACHTAPSQDGGAAGVAAAPSTLATKTIGELAEVQQQPAGNETVVVAGDFNVSLFDPAATGVAYRPFAAAYTKVVNTVGGAAMPAGYPARGYLITHIKTRSQATPGNTDGYPAFGYMSKTDQHGQYDSIDNAFVRGGAVANATIANLVTGAPYDKVNPPPQGMPTGNLAYRSVLRDPRSLNVPRGYIPTSNKYIDWRELFRDIDNYGNVYGVSDHLPVVFDF